MVVDELQPYHRNAQALGGLPPPEALEIADDGLLGNFSVKIMGSSTDVISAFETV
jgi:hypothetical protein